jgi:hypothetical protein
MSTKKRDSFYGRGFLDRNGGYTTDGKRQHKKPGWHNEYDTDEEQERATKRSRDVPALPTYDDDDSVAQQEAAEKSRALLPPALGSTQVEADERHIAAALAETMREFHGVSALQPPLLLRSAYFLTRFCCSRQTIADVRVPMESDGGRSRVAVLPGDGEAVPVRAAAAEEAASPSAPTSSASSSSSCTQAQASRDTKLILGDSGRSVPLTGPAVQFLQKRGEESPEAKACAQFWSNLSQLDGVKRAVGSRYEWYMVDGEVLAVRDEKQRDVLFALGAVAQFAPGDDTCFSGVITDITNHNGSVRLHVHALQSDGTFSKRGRAVQAAWYVRYVRTATHKEIDELRANGSHEEVVASGKRQSPKLRQHSSMDLRTASRRLSVS